ncbi:MAG: NAD(P)H-dependent oxidoreductase subunit E, partial [Chloroflexota bacterium]|nr:NAD(P)H-dependent oxidoreductase subunit E [Chloroflexota bacterium]
MDVEIVTKEARLNFRKELVNRFQRSREQLLPSLHWVQKEYGYLPEWALEILSWHIGVSASEVYGAATTY